MFMKQAIFSKPALCTGIAAVALAAAAGCTTAGTSNTSTKTAAGAGAGSAAASIRLTPVAAIQAMIDKTSGDQSVTVTGTSTSKAGNSQFSGQEQTGTNYAMQMTATSDGAATSMILTDDAFYIKSPAISALTGGKPWAQFDISGTGVVATAMQAAVQTMRSEDPSQQLQEMLASDNLADVGSATVNGVQTVHYSGTVDPATAFASSTTAKYLTPAQIQSIQAVLKAEGITSEQIDVWVGSNDLPVELKTAAKSAVLGTTTSDVFFTNWGGGLTVTLPPASQVGNVSSLLGGSQ
jgi:hypothetical protein